MMASHAVKLWKKATVIRPLHLRVEDGSQYRGEPVANTCSTLKFQLSLGLETNLAAELHNAQSFPVTPRHEEMPTALWYWSCSVAEAHKRDRSRVECGVRSAAAIYEVRARKTP